MNGAARALDDDALAARMTAAAHRQARARMDLRGLASEALRRDWPVVRVSMLTGLHRQTVRRIRDAVPEGPEGPE